MGKKILVIYSFSVKNKLKKIESFILNLKEIKGSTVDFLEIGKTQLKAKDRSKYDEFYGIDLSLSQLKLPVAQIKTSYVYIRSVDNVLRYQRILIKAAKDCPGAEKLVFFSMQRFLN